MCKKKGLAAALLLASAGAMATGNAQAGGYDTGERDWDFLFQQDDAAVEASVRYIVPDRSISNVMGILGPSKGVREGEPMAVPRFSAMARLGDDIRCMASYREPFGGHAEQGIGWTYAAAVAEQHFTSRDLGLTCAYGFEMEQGVLSLLGGVSYQEIEYVLEQFLVPPMVPINTSINTKVNDSGFGWRAGLAYEIPEYALRASLIYNSAINYDMTGKVTNTLSPFSPLAYSGPVKGSLTMPQSAEFKLQSGIAPGWLAFGSVKWTDWSVVDQMPLCVPGTPVCNSLTQVSGLVLKWKDSWTATIGAAHQFSDAFSLAASLTWDQGATTGFTPQTDTWVLGLTGVFTPDENIVAKLGGAIGLMEGGSYNTFILPGGVINPVGYSASFGDDYIYSASANLTVRF